MTTITDEDVERAARAVKRAMLEWKAANGGDDASCVDMPDELVARTALEATLPGVVERAEIFDMLMAQYKGWREAYDDQSRAVAVAFGNVAFLMFPEFREKASEIAAAIRKVEG